MSDGTRTRDNRDHNPGLYQLSYAHHCNRSVPRFTVLISLYTKDLSATDASASRSRPLPTGREVYRNF